MAATQLVVMAGEAIVAVVSEEVEVSEEEEEGGVEDSMGLHLTITGPTVTLGITHGLTLLLHGPSHLVLILLRPNTLLNWVFLVQHLHLRFVPSILLPPSPLHS